MDKKKTKSLVLRILTILELIENKKNQAKIQEIKGLLFELLESD